MTIGFIGLGIMGSRMVANLQHAGKQLIIFNRTPAKAEALIANGAQLATNPAEVGRHSATIITMLAHPQAVEAAALDHAGFLDQLQAGALWIDCSTGNPAFARRMAAEAAKRGVAFIDAPVTGSKGQAEAGQLVFLAGGNVEDLAAADELFSCMGRQTIHVGIHGMGTALKLVFNLLLANAMASFAEGLAFGESLGISRETLLDTLLGAPIVAPFLSFKRAKLANNSYAAEFPLRWMHKDLAMIAAAASSAAIPLATTTAALYQQALEYGLGDQDFSAIAQLFQADEQPTMLKQ
ncbi:NAD(P)-dependent oxidoreductase [Herpetosiphon sp. NSE202]|uniref:NAD(P)-dependent oxidoreductase n=1 Tax=Herpetosiphon sp. NSE202 TaxID=3351349 RepID=UPI00363115F6